VNKHNGCNFLCFPALPLDRKSLRRHHPGCTSARVASNCIPPTSNSQQCHDALQLSQTSRTFTLHSSPIVSQQYGRHKCTAALFAVHPPSTLSLFDIIAFDQIDAEGSQLDTKEKCVPQLTIWLTSYRQRISLDTFSFSLSFCFFFSYVRWHTDTSLYFLTHWPPC
jgi:hypothetical protein